MLDMLKGLATAILVFILILVGLVLLPIIVAEAWLCIQVFKDTAIIVIGIILGGIALKVIIDLFF